MNKKTKLTATKQILSEINYEINEVLDTDESSKFYKSIEIAGKECVVEMTREDYLTDTLIKIQKRVENDVLPIIEQ